MQNSLRPIALLGAFFVLSISLAAQSRTGSIDLVAHIAPSGARPEPVRQFALFVLTKSYAEVVKEVEAQDTLPTREQFIDSRKCSPELKAWMKAHDTIDLASTDLNLQLTPDDIMKVPEFFAAYERSNSGGVTRGLPRPKYRDADKTANPARYQKQKEEFLAETRKFIETNPATVQGIEMELIESNPRHDWDALQGEHKRKMAQLAPDTAQLKYLAGKTETDLDGRAFIAGLPPGNYWVTSLGVEAASGDRRLVWDVPVTLQAGQTAHLELSNLNASEPRKAATP